MRYLIALVVILSAISCSTAVDVFPVEGDYPANLFVLGMPKNAEAIGMKFQRAMASQPEWVQSFLEANRNLKPGEFLPYHKNFGITEEEYKIFVAATEKMTLNKIGDVVVHVQKTETTMTISIEGATLPVSRFEFSADGKTMTCELGSTGQAKDFDQSDTKSPTGKWHGIEWILEKGSPNIAESGEGTNLKLAIGKDELNRDLIYLRLLRRQGRQGQDVGVVIRWPNG